jgi:anaerobic magnesium-protoporphyrin IX monomethyl ester cyclase
MDAMSNVLFTNGYFYRLDAKQWRFKQPYPPLGTLLAAAVVRSAGYNVDFFDNNFQDSAEAIEQSLRKRANKYFVIYDDGFNYLTKMCLTVMREAVFRMAAIGKQYECVVIVSSSDATDQYEKYLTNNVDYVVRGEGEETLRELLVCLDRNEKPGSVAGVAYKEGEQTILTANRNVIKDLDSLPLPAWDLLDVEPYRKLWVKHHGYFSLNIATTRGCPFKCNWCAKPIYGNRYNSRSPEKVVDEIDFLVSTFKPDHFWMCDDIFGLKPGWIQSFGHEIQKRNLTIKYKIQSRVDLLLEDDTIESLAQSGAETIWVGAESGSQAILDAMDKGTTIKQIYEATHLLKKNNIRVAFFLQFGYLGETRSDIDSTIKMVLDLMPDEIGISVSYPLPGTKFYEKVKNQLAEKQNWSDSDDLAMMFDSTFRNDYYKELHRYVHHVYRTAKGYDSLKRLFKNPLQLEYADIRAGILTLYHAPSRFIRSKKLRQIELSAS